MLKHFYLNVYQHQEEILIKHNVQLRTNNKNRYVYTSSINFKQGYSKKLHLFIKLQKHFFKWHGPAFENRFLNVSPGCY